MKYLLPFILLVSIGASAQLQRYDNYAATTTSASGIGNLTQIIPNATLQLFNYPGVGVSCAGGGCVAATTFTSRTGATACGAGVPLTRPTATTCLSTADAQGNFGFWAAAGNYQYCVVATFTTQCLNITLGPALDASNIQYANQFSGADWCAKVNAAIAALPSAGGIVDARGFTGAQTCAANPFASVTKPVHLLWGNYTVTTNVKWTLAATDIVIEGIHSQPGSVQTSFLQAGASFPTSTAVIEMGDNAAIYFGQRIEYLRIHCNQIAGTIGILMRGLNEYSGTDHVAISECIGNAIKIDGSVQNTANFAIHDTSTNNSSAVTGDAISLGTVNGNITLDRMSINSVSLQTTAAIHVTSSGSNNNFIRDIHTEAFTDGVLADGSNLYVNGISCFTGTVNCLHVPSPGTGNATSVVAQSILNNSNNTNTVVKNDVTGLSIASTNPPAANGSVPWYSWSRTAGNEAWMDNLGLHSRNLLTTEGTAPAAAAGSDVCYGDSTAHALKCSYNNASFFNQTQTIGTGNVTTAGTAINTLTCQAQTGITVTGAATTDNVLANIGAALPATWQTGIVLSAHVTATNTVTVYLCNPTATASITPAATQVNVRVLR